MFDLNRLKINKSKNSELIKASKFYSLMVQDIIDRLEPIEKSYRSILLINNNIESLTTKLQSQFPASSISTWQYPNSFEEIKQKFDLVIFPFGLHWVVEIQFFLAEIRKLLEPTGILMCNFAGGGSLYNLRRLLLQLEIDHLRPCAPHLSPLIQFEHVTPLLQQAGFAENIIDMESFELEYETPLKLMYAIKDLGESNVLFSTCYSITKKMYGFLSKAQDKNFVDNFNLITFLSSTNKKSVKLKAEYFNPGPRT